MTDRFDACLAETLQWEGSWSNHPADPGGATMRGVIQRVYDGYRELKGLARQTVRSITEDELRDIYRGNYWRLAGDQLPPGVDLAVFDFGVNSGPARAARHLQACLGVAQDGAIGPVTIQEASRADPDKLVAALCQARRKFVRQIKTYPTFGKGWERRINGVEVAALGMAAGVELVKPEPLPEIARAQATQEAAPASSVKVGTLAAAGASSAVAVASKVIEAPPAAVTDAVTSLTLWQKVGEQMASFGKFVFTHPVEVGLIVAIVAAVWLAPRLLPVIWSRQT